MEGVSTSVQTLLEASSVPVLWDILWLKMVCFARVCYKIISQFLLLFENHHIFSV